MVDPAAGTAGFLLAADDFASRDAEKLTPTQREHLRDTFVHGTELVDGTARLAAMNLLLHGIGTPRGESLIEVKDSLIADPGTRHTVVLSNPPRAQVLADNGRRGRARGPRRPGDRAAGLRGHHVEQALFFDKKPAGDRPWTERLWVYDTRSNQHFTLKQNPLRRCHLDEFVECYAPCKPRSERFDSERFKPFTYDELMARDKANLDITWLRDETLEDLDNLPAPEIVARVLRN